MRTISETLAPKLAAGVTTLAHVWRVQRRDGEGFAFTDHDRSLTLDAITAEPVEGLSGGVIEKSAGLSADSASIAGALSSATITEADLARGLWDGARVDVYRVDWTNPADRVHLFAGHIGEVRRGVSAFEAELRGLQAALNTPVGRVYSRFCDADLGDQRCGKDIDDEAFRGEGDVSELLGSHVLKASGLEAYADGWFSRGRVVWADASACEVAVHRTEEGGAVIELLDHPGANLALGAAFVIYAGCDKRFGTCRAKFANAINFRGFPHMAGNDAVQAGPIPGDRLDGGSRFS
ncbi:MAG: DUF2163 domain-containing protein [Hyphomonadaceae bacterium]